MSTITSIKSSNNVDKISIVIEDTGRFIISENNATISIDKQELILLFRIIRQELVLQRILPC